MPRLKRTVGVNCERKQMIMLKGDETRSPERISIRTINDRPLWHLFKDFINSLEKDQKFSRKDLLEHIYVPKAAEAIRSHETTVDHYRLYSCHIGYVDHVSTGQYIKKHPIPDNMTSTMLKRFAYNREEWRDWFIPKDMKIQTIKELCQ